MKCPKCDLNQPDTNLECPRCGVIFAKLGFTPQPEDAPGSRIPPPPLSQIESIPGDKRPSGRPNSHPVPRDGREPRRPASASGSAIPVVPPVSHPGQEDAPLTRRNQQAPEADRDLFSVDEEESIPEPRCLDAKDWLILATGPIIALACMYFFWTRHILNTLMILVHEMGHAIVGWMFGYPSLPAFDLQYGGGVTVHTERWTALLILIYVGFAVLFFLYRKNVWALVLLSLVVVIHGLLAFTSGHEALILFMGHGTELVIAGIFIYRAVSGSKVVHAIERPLYGIIGFYIVLADITFAWGLMTSPAKRAAYGAAKGGGHWMDFSRIAYEHFQVHLTAVAVFFLMCCLAPPILAFLVFRYQEYLHLGISRLARREREA